MLSVATTRCHEFGQAELVLAFNPRNVIEKDVRWFAAGLEQMVQSGSRFQAGQSLQIGWSIAWFVALPDNALGFEEPDMKSMPVVRQPGLTNSLAHLRLHKDTLESVLSAEALSFPSLQQSCLVCTHLSSSGSFLMDRQRPEGGDSGWFIGCQADGHDHNDPSSLRRASLYEAVIAMCPRALAYLAFPVGATIAVDEAPLFFVAGEPLEPRKGSFVDVQRRYQQGQSIIA